MRENYNEYIYTLKIFFGKYKGFFMKDIPNSYIEWGVLNIRDRCLATMFKIELQRRIPKLK